MRLTKTQIQRKLDSLCAALNKAMAARDALAEHCLEVYGTTWSDLDIDEIIDGIGDGGASTDGFDASRFIELMDEATGK